MDSVLDGWWGWCLNVIRWMARQNIIRCPSPTSLTEKSEGGGWEPGTVADLSIISHWFFVNVFHGLRSPVSGRLLKANKKCSCVYVFSTFFYVNLSLKKKKKHWRCWIELMPLGVICEFSPTRQINNHYFYKWTTWLLGLQRCMNLLCKLDHIDPGKSTWIYSYGLPPHRWTLEKSALHHWLSLNTSHRNPHSHWFGHAIR